MLKFLANPKLRTLVIASHSGMSLIITLLAIVIWINPLRVAGQTPTPAPTPTPESEEIKRLREEKTRAELERDIATARKAELEAKYPKPSTSPLAGQTQIDKGAVIEAEMLAYRAMAEVAERIVQSVKDARQPGSQCRITIGKLAIYNKSDIDLLLSYEGIKAQLKILKDQFDNLLKKDPALQPAYISPTQGLSIVNSFLGAFVDVTALLRTDVNIQGHPVNIEEASLVAEVFRVARKDLTDINGFYYPAMFPPIKPGLESRLLKELEILNDLKPQVLEKKKEYEELLKEISRTKQQIEQLKTFIKVVPKLITDARGELNRLETSVNEAAPQGQRPPFSIRERIAKLRERIEKLTSEQNEAPKKLAELEDKLGELQDPWTEEELRALIARLNLVNERFDHLIDRLIKTDTASGVNSLTSYIRAENLIAALGEDGYWLQVAVVKAGGNNRTKTNFIVDTFTGGNRLSHSGGVVVHYNLYNSEGNSVVSGTLMKYTGYVKAKAIKGL